MRDSPLQAGDLQPVAAAWLGWLETLLLTAAVPAVRIALGWVDPFLCRSVFPWLVCVPLAVGVQHGLVCALVSATLLCAGAGAYAVSETGHVPPLEVGAAYLVIAAASGRARDANRERCERLSRRVSQLERSIGRERASRQVLQLSHERLSQQLAGAQHSVQATVEAAVPRLPALRSVAELGRLVLDMLAQHADLQRGAVFVAGGQGRLLEPAVAELGQGDATSRMWARSPLVTRAFQTRRLTSVVDTVGVLGDGRDQVLAALPLLAADAKVLGVVAITQMPFTAFHPAALRQAFVLVSQLMGEVEPEQWKQWIEALERAGERSISAARVRDGEPREQSDAGGKTKWGSIA
jgi:hypothetical protein